MAPSPLSSAKKRLSSSNSTPSTNSPLSPTLTTNSTPPNQTTSSSLNNSTTAGIQYAINPNIAANKNKRKMKEMNWIERNWVWYEGSFAISMLETWEKVVLHIFLITLFSLLYYASVRYLPGQVQRVAGRVKYYISGSE